MSVSKTSQQREVEVTRAIDGHQHQSEPEVFRLLLREVNKYLETFNVVLLSDATNCAIQADLLRESVPQPSSFRSYANMTRRDEATPIDGRFIMPE